MRADFHFQQRMSLFGELQPQQGEGPEGLRWPNAAAEEEAAWEQRMPIALIVEADEPAIFFSSIENAENYLETIDVRNGVYPAAFGPRGELYRISVKDERVVVQQLPLEPRADELQELLKRFLTAVGANASGDLADLLAGCERYISA